MGFAFDEYEDSEDMAEDAAEMTENAAEVAEDAAAEDITEEVTGVEETEVSEADA